MKRIIKAHYNAVMYCCASHGLNCQYDQPLLDQRLLKGIHTGRVVGQIAAQIGPDNLLWCWHYKKIVPTRRYYRGDRRAN